MGAFNIRINTQDKEVTLTILQEDNEYKIIYFGGIIGAFKKNQSNFNFIEPEAVTPGSLPLFKYKQAESIDEETELRLNKHILNQVIMGIKEHID